jgi:hypothetical protein
MKKDIFINLILNLYLIILIYFYLKVNNYYFFSNTEVLYKERDLFLLLFFSSLIFISVTALFIYNFIYCRIFRFKWISYILYFIYILLVFFVFVFYLGE